MLIGAALTSFVLLKYNILTSDPSTWHLCSRYPKEVRDEWAWRCVADCEHLAKGYPGAEKCIEVAKKYRDGLATRGELDAAISSVHDSTAYYNSAVHNAACYAAITCIYANSWHLAARAAYYAVCAVAVREQSRKWDLYISWLVEELGAWEQTHG